MPLYRNFQPDDPLPADWTRAIEEFISNMAGANFRITKASSTSIQCVAGTGDDQVAVGIDGKPRWITATAVASHPGGAAGTHDVWVTANPDAFSTDIDGNEQDDTNHAFALKIKTAPSGSGAETLSRKVARLVWDGTQIVSLTQIIGATSEATPTGPAGGDLGGTYPDPEVAQVNGHPAADIIAEGDSRLTNERTPVDASVDGNKIANGAITNIAINAAAGIARTKLDFGLGLVNADIATGAAIAKSKIDFTTGIVNADVDAAAAIARSKLALTDDGAAGVPSLRTLGTGAQQAAAGNDPRFAGGASGAAGGVLRGTYPNPQLAVIPSVRLRRNSGQNINGSQVTITGYSQVHISGNISWSSGTVTIAVAGIYFIAGNVVFSPNANGSYRTLYLDIGGTAVAQQNYTFPGVAPPGGGGSLQYGLNISTAVLCGIGDQIFIQAGSDVSVNLEANSTYLTVVYMGPGV